MDGAVHQRAATPTSCPAVMRHEASEVIGPLWKLVVSHLTGAALAFAFMSVPVLAQGAIDPSAREQLYACGIGPTANEGLLTLTAVSRPDGTYTDLQFRGEIPGERSILFPPKPAPGEGNFFFSNTDGPEGYLVSVRFSQNGVNCRLYSLATPPGPDENAGGGSGGLVITEADGSQREIVCDEAVYEFISYMRYAMSCDIDPRYGKAYCDIDNVPTRLAADPLP